MITDTRTLTVQSAVISITRFDGPVILSGIYAAEHHDLLPRGSLDPALSASLIAQWDFSQAMHGTRVLGVGPFGYHGRLVQLPARAMKGWNWSGEEHNRSRKPEHYGAIYLRRRWETSVALTNPQDLRSGPYALHVQCGQSDGAAPRGEEWSSLDSPGASGAHPTDDHRKSALGPKADPSRTSETGVYGFCEDCRKIYEFATRSRALFGLARVLEAP